MKKKIYYPIFLDLEKLPCLVVGGGQVAEKKVDALLTAGARVAVVSPKLTHRLLSLHKKKKISWKKTAYRKSYLKSGRLVIGATNDAKTNEKVFNDAEELHIPVNIVDNKELCRFIVPAVVSKGDIQIAISTGGAAPALAAHIRDKVNGVIEKELKSMVAILNRLRPQIKELPQKAKSAFWNSITSINFSKIDSNYKNMTTYVQNVLKRSKQGK